VRIRVVWTDASLDHIAKHRVSRDEVDVALPGNQYVRSVGGQFVVIAAARSRALFIVHDPLPAEPGFAALSTARPAEPPEKRLLWRRGKGMQ
jgi:hypothetical protein